jgi:hypothetical protein
VFAPSIPHFCHPQDSKFRLILIESRVHRIARYYKKVLACASELGLYVSVFRVLLRIFGWGFRFWFWLFCVSTSIVLGRISPQHSCFFMYYPQACNSLVALFLLLFFAPALPVAIAAPLVTLDPQSHSSSPAFCICNFSSACAHTLSQVGKLAPTWKYVSSTASAMVA